MPCCHFQWLLKLTEGRDHLYTTESWQGRRWETCDAEALVDAGTCYPCLSFPTHSRDRKGDALQGRSVPTLPSAPPALGASHCPVQQEEFLSLFPQHLELQHLGIPTYRQVINAQHVMKPPHLFFFLLPWTNCCIGFSPKYRLCFHIDPILL